jgi:hypothetical protein
MIYHLKNGGLHYDYTVFNAFFVQGQYFTSTVTEYVNETRQLRIVILYIWFYYWCWYTQDLINKF